MTCENITPDGSVHWPEFMATINVSCTAGSSADNTPLSQHDIACSTFILIQMFSGSTRLGVDGSSLGIDCELILSGVDWSGPAIRPGLENRHLIILIPHSCL